MGEADIVIRPATLPPINLVAAVDCRVSNFLLVLLTKKNMKIIKKDIVFMAIIGFI